MKNALVTLLFVVAATPVSAESSRGSSITCETVRAYVSQVGLTAARAIARAHGMTASQERRARQCLARAD